MPLPDGIEITIKPWCMPSGRWRHEILNLPPSLIVFRRHWNELEDGVRAFIRFSIASSKILLMQGICKFFDLWPLTYDLWPVKTFGCVSVWKGLSIAKIVHSGSSSETLSSTLKICEYLSITVTLAKHDFYYHVFHCVAHIRQWLAVNTIVCCWGDFWTYEVALYAMLTRSNCYKSHFHLRLYLGVYL